MVKQIISHFYCQKKKSSFSQGEVEDWVPQRKAPVASD